MLTDGHEHCSKCCSPQKSIDKASIEAIKCITEVSVKQQHILMKQGSLCIAPIRGFLLSGQCHIWKHKAAPH